MMPSSPVLGYNSSMRIAPDRQRKGTLYITAILIAAAVATLISTAIIYRNSLNAAEESLRLQALGIAASLEPSLRDIKGKNTLFADITTEAAWEGIAFIALYDNSGRILLHSNEELMGKQADLKKLGIAPDQKTATHDFMTLGTGEEVFIFTYPFRVKDSIHFLRLALHPYPAENIIRQARLQAIIILAILTVLLIIGSFLVRAVKRSDRLAAAMADKERLAAIGEMAAVLAHEIRNPLGSIKGFAQYLSERQKEGRDELAIIVNEAGRLERLTEDLLLYSRPSEVRMSELILSELVAEVAAVIRESDHAKRFGISVKTSVPDEIILLTDREKLKQIIFNLLDNAVEAVSNNGTVEIFAEQVDDRVIIAISDDGCGMDDTVKSRAFESFYTTKAKGTGLGLAIVGRLIMSLGGEIDMRSVPGKGTLFTITLSAKYNADHA